MNQVTQNQENFFKKMKHIDTFNYLIQYLDYPEIINLCLVNKKFAQVSQKNFNKETLKILKKKYFNEFNFNYPNGNIDWEELNKFYLEIKDKEKNIHHDTLITHLSYFILKNNFKDELCLSNWYGGLNLNLEIKKFSLIHNFKILTLNCWNIFKYDANLFFKTILEIPLRNLLDLTIINMPLNEPKIYVIITFKKMNKSLNSIELIGTEIGKTEASLKLLVSFLEKDNLKYINLNSNLYNSDSVPIIKKILNSSENKFEFFSIQLNQFIKSDIEELATNFKGIIADFLIGFHRFFYYEFRYNVSLVINFCFDWRNYDVNQEKYFIAGLSGIYVNLFQELSNIDNYAISRFFIELYEKNCFRNLKLNINFSMDIHILKLILENLSKSEIDRIVIIDSSSRTNPHKVNIVIETIKQLRKVMSLELILINFDDVWFDVLIDFMQEDFLEELKFDRIQTIPEQKILELIKHAAPLKNLSNFII